MRLRPTVLSLMAALIVSQTVATGQSLGSLSNRFTVTNSKVDHIYGNAVGRVISRPTVVHPTGPVTVIAGNLALNNSSRVVWGQNPSSALVTVQPLLPSQRVFIRGNEFVNNGRIATVGSGSKTSAILLVEPGAQHIDDRANTFLNRGIIEAK